MKSTGSTRAQLKKALVGYAFVSPWIIGFLVFATYPFLASVYFSLTRYNIVTAPQWVGLGNYRILSADPVFWHSLFLTFAYAFIAVPIGILAGVALALLLNVEVRGISVYRTIFTCRPSFRRSRPQWSSSGF